MIRSLALLCKLETGQNISSFKAEWQNGYKIESFLIRLTFRSNQKILF